MARILMLLISIVVISLAGAASAQTEHAVPPGGAIVFGPFGPEGQEAAISTVAVAKGNGSVFLTDDKLRFVYRAPPAAEAEETASIEYKLAGEALPRQAEVTVDPAYSAGVRSATGTALEWLMVLMIVALFIEAAVLVLVSVIQVLLRWYAGGPSGVAADGPKPSVYKPVFAVILSGIAVAAFGLDPLDEIYAAFGSDPSIDLGNAARVMADMLITTLLVAGGAESVRRVASGIVGGLKMPTATEMVRKAEAADKSAIQGT